MDSATDFDSRLSVLIIGFVWAQLISQGRTREARAQLRGHLGLPERAAQPLAIGFFGVERRAHGQSAPGYQMLLGGHVGQEKIAFGDKALRVRAKAAPEAAIRVLRRYVEERDVAEPFRTWMDRVGGATSIADDLSDLGAFPEPAERPDFYVDYDETGPYVKEVGASECAT